MYLGKLRDTASHELRSAVSDVVLAVPGWYTDIQRRAIQDAAAIAGLNTLRVINDTTAAALSWGITKTDLPEPENPRHILFVDVGHSSMSVAVVAFSKGQLVVKAAAYDRHLGGRDIDYALLQHFATQFKTKYKIDVLSSPKATFRLAVGCERLKKILSANSEAPLNVESIMNDIDASSKLSRETYEDLIAPVLDRIAIPLQQALTESGLSIDQIDAVELIGGTTRIPAVRARIQAALGGKLLSTTLNQDEAVARGATFACAFFSPTFRVREFHVRDIAQYPIKVSWDRSESDPDEDTELVVFPRGNAIPSTKVLTFYRKGPFDIEASYAEPQGLPGRINPWVARFGAKSVPADPSGDLSCVKLKTRLNLHGIMSFESAYVEEVEEKEDQEAMEVDGNAPPADAPKKKRVKKLEVPFTSFGSSLDASVIDKFREQEAQMHAADKLVQDTEVRTNCPHTRHDSPLLGPQKRPRRIRLRYPRQAREPLRRLRPSRRKSQARHVAPRSRRLALLGRRRGRHQIRLRRPPRRAQGRRRPHRRALDRRRRPSARHRRTAHVAQRLLGAGDVGRRQVRAH
jgi:heat shock protein 4